MNETINQITFLKQTVVKFKEEIHKFLADPNYASHNVVGLKHNIEDIEKEIINKEKDYANFILHKNLEKFQKNKTHLPIINSNSTMIYRKKSDIKGFENNLGSSKQIDHNPTSQNEKNIFKSNINKRRKAKEDPISKIIGNRKAQYNDKKNFDNLIKKYDVDSNSENVTLKRPIATNFMNKKILLKYSTIGKGYNFQGITYDEDNRPIIDQNDFDKGLINMIYKGIISKNTDLTPAFNREGNPLKMRNKSEISYARKAKKDNHKQGSVVDKSKLEIKEKKDNVFITNDINTSKFVASKLIKGVENLEENNSNKTDEEKSFDYDKLIENENSENENLKNSDNNKVSINHQEVSNIQVDSSKVLSDSNVKTLTSIQKNNSAISISKEHIPIRKHTVAILFVDFKVIRNENYKEFYTANAENWGFISYLIDQLQKLFQKLNFKFLEVDREKLELLASDELRSIAIKDLMSVLTDKELKSRGLEPFNHKKLLYNIREASILRIQNTVRAYIARKKLESQRQMLNKISKIQRIYKLHKLLEASRCLINEKKKENKKVWDKIMDKFKINWPRIKSGHRIEVHINSLSLTLAKNFTIEKFNEKENNQLSRLVALSDPNVEIIYISPYPLGNEILSYYFTILQSLGIENSRERFHLIVPEFRDYFSPALSLSKHLLYCDKSVNSIRRFISGREDVTYIIPGTASSHDIDLAIYMDLPILMGDVDKTEALFSKSGSKRVFELTEMALPVSAWDVKSEEEFYNILTHLIKNYITVNVWIFKINNEFGGRGVAYIILDKIKDYVDLKKDKQNKLTTEEKFEADLFCLLKKFVPRKTEIVTNKIYKSWLEFFTEYIKSGGVIEACPTNSLSSIIGSPAITFLIEPDGSLDSLFSYDKINCNYFRNIGAISPQISIPNLNTDLIIEKIGKFLYSEGIIGYVTVEFVSYYDNQKILFWAIDLRFGLSDIIANLKLCEFLYIQSKSYRDNNSSTIDHRSELDILGPTIPYSPYYSFTMCNLIHSGIAKIKMKDFVHFFRSEQIVFDLEKQNGVLFNLPDILQCGMIGISGLSSNFKSLLKLIDNSISIIRNEVYNTGYKVHTYSDTRSDGIELSDVFSRLKTYMKKFEEKKNVYQFK